MLTFLRKIRKSLIDSGATQKPASPAGRYILYAIGEILLVMIGILLALQVNNWNQKRLDYKNEREFIKSMVEDLKLDQEIIQTTNSYLKKKISVAQQILRESKAISTFQDTVQYGNLTWQVNRSLFFKQRNQEDIKSLRSKNLQRELGEYISLQERLERSLAVLNQMIQEDIRPFYRKNGLVNVSTALENRSYDDLQSDQSNAVLYEKLKAQYGNAEFEGLVHQIYLGSMSLMDHADKLMTKNIEMVVLLNEL